MHIDGLTTFSEYKSQRRESGNRRNKEETLGKGLSVGLEHEKMYRGCSQCAIAAIHDNLDVSDDSVFKAGTGLAPWGQSGYGVCGGYVYGVMVL